MGQVNVFNRRKEGEDMNLVSVNRMALACILAVLAVLSAAAVVQAADGPKLKLEFTTQKEVKAVKDGREVIERVPVEEAFPGDVLVYTITYTNTGDAEAKNAVILDPIPEGIDYVVGSAEGAGAEITCSIDGGESYHAEPVMTEVENPDGTKKKQEADPGAYTHVRWRLDSVPAGGSGKVTFKAIVER